MIDTPSNREFWEREYRRAMRDIEHYLLIEGVRIDADKLPDLENTARLRKAWQQSWEIFNKLRDMK